MVDRNRPLCERESELRRARARSSGAIARSMPARGRASSSGLVQAMSLLDWRREDSLPNQKAPPPARAGPARAGPARAGPLGPDRSGRTARAGIDRDGHPSTRIAELFHRCKLQLGNRAHQRIWGLTPRKRQEGSKEQKKFDTLALPQSVSPGGASEAKRKNDQAPGKVRRENK